MAKSPTFDIQVTDARLLQLMPQTISRNNLTLDGNSVYYWDIDTNCVMEFIIKDDGLYDSIDGTFKLAEKI